MNRPRTIVKRQAPVRSKAPPQSDAGMSFSFGFDDDMADSAPTTMTKSSKIDAVLAQSSGEIFHVAQIKLREPVQQQQQQELSPLQQHQDDTTQQQQQQQPETIEVVPEHIREKREQDKALQPTNITFYPPHSLSIPKPIRESHYIKECNPGVHVVYAPSFPPAAAKNTKPTQQVKKTTTPPPSTPLPTPTRDPSTDLPTVDDLCKTSKNVMPTWVMSLTKLNPNDFDCPLSALPDIMLDPTDYLLSLPNPTDKIRNMFVSISTPLRCVTERGTVLESAYGVRKLRSAEDKRLIQHTREVQKLSQQQQQPQQQSPETTQTKTKQTKKDTTPTHWKEQQQIIKIASLDTDTNDFPSDEPVVLTETTTFVVVLPPKSLIDLCYILPTFHTHDHIAQRAQRHNAIPHAQHKVDINDISYEIRDTTRVYNVNELLSLLSQPLNCQDVSKQLCTDEMPLEEAEQWISSHLSSQQYTTTTNDLPAKYIPILPFPLPPQATYYLSQTMNGIMTHHSLQTRYAVDLCCVNGTPVYAPRDGYVDDVNNKSCSIGNHVTNLFDWNSITFKCAVDKYIVPYHHNTATALGNDNNTPPQPVSIPHFTQQPAMTPNETTTPEQQQPQQQHIALSKDELSQIYTTPLYIDFVHLNKIVVKKNQFVKAGELLGYTGSSGFCPTPHLHIQVSLSNSSHAVTIPFVFEPHALTPSQQQQQTQFTALEAGYAYDPIRGILVSGEKHTQFTTSASNLYQAHNTAHLPTPLPAMNNPTDDLRQSPSVTQQPTNPTPAAKKAATTKKQQQQTALTTTNGPTICNCTPTAQTTTALNTIYPQNIAMNPFVVAATAKEYVAQQSPSAPTQRMAYHEACALAYAQRGAE